MSKRISRLILRSHNGSLPSNSSPAFVTTSRERFSRTKPSRLIILLEEYRYVFLCTRQWVR
ncbi:hypothetical protein BT96DRAFT_308293 [Gymnopus androsaceus JB14]|uniref:Uncharacterized protein n=1 Tax=Gymnopus androsaceus JB14 TaxID=1447944 RepID=A0A6A4H280_9AGAR|nr:hypothetical protein BT96DRAFT_308293 [Gymnopus androsaceus JB14]